MKKALVISAMNLAFQTMRKQKTEKLILTAFTGFEIVKTPSGAMVQTPYQKILLVRENGESYVQVICRNEKCHVLPFTKARQKEDTVNLLSRHKLLPTKKNFQNISCLTRGFSLDTVNAAVVGD